MESEYGSFDFESEGLYQTASAVDEQDFNHWSEENSLDDEVDTFDDVALVAYNFKIFHELQEQWPGGFFQFLGDEWEVGRKFAEGGLAEIFEVQQTLHDGTKENRLLKMFNRGFSLEDVEKLFPEGMLKNLGPNGLYSKNHCCSIYGVRMLQNGRFGILMKQYWGDLRQLIDQRVILNNNQDLLFPDMSIVIQIILDIALGMQALHEDGIIHRDLKASNVLIQPLKNDYDPIHSGKFTCHVADFETSNGVTGTLFWRAPEILNTIKNRNIFKRLDLFTEKSDVYSFAMTCYEILTGRIPFEECRGSDFDVVLQGKRPQLPEFLDLEIRELLIMCWHRDPLQRPSFEVIVDTLQERLGKKKEPHIPAPCSSTWEELNDPRIKRDRDPSIEIPRKFPILIEMLASALQCCEEEVGKIKRCKDQVTMFKNQCVYLITSLSSGVDKIFCQFQQVRQILEELVITNVHRPQLELNHWFKYVAFAIHSLVSLTRNLQTVVEMLSKCGAKDWWKTALQYSTPPPHPQIPRWSVFGLALQQCQWSMDIVHLAINKIELANGFGGEMLNNAKFQWCEEQQRPVLQNTKEHSNILGVIATLEAQDRGELIKKLESFLYKNLQHKSCLNEFKLASFLMTKLNGPIPQASYLPYSFQIDPPSNLVSRSPVTAIWCDKILCYMKKCKAKAFEVRKIVEMDAAPLAAVQHPNVVQLIGCTVETSKNVTGLTEVLTKLVHPSEKKSLHEATGVVVMELMEGNLQKLIKQRCPHPRPSSRAFPLMVALDIMLQIAEAMRFVHEHKILHRDLKTTNILFTSASTRALPSHTTLDLNHIRELELLYLLTPEQFYTVKLADFGEAKYAPNKSIHIVEAKSGTPQYMAPEMFYNPEAQMPNMYNWSCDVYSFAMTCSAILTGNEPFHFVKKPTMDVMAIKVNQARPHLGLGLGKALPSLKTLIERCWDKDPLKRPPFSEICKDLWDIKVKTTISCL